MNTPQTAIGKGKVGEKAKDELGRTAVTVRLALFFDGTLNNRTNTKKRLSKPGILDDAEKNERSSYANFFSNVAIMEYMNLRKNPSEQHVSVYVEGIGTVDFEEGATEKIKDDKNDKDNKKEKKDLLDKNGNPIPIKDADNSNDDRQGYAFGSGDTGITMRVAKGIEKASEDIKNKAYKPKEQFIEKIFIDVIGFSRGAAAARHFVSLRDQVPGPLPKQSAPELVINFVGLYETVSSFDEGGEDNWGVLGNAAQKVTEGLFDDDVLQLHLNMDDVPKRVVHLTAADEYRNNFSLTTINTSLKAGVGFELELPGVHSDVGGAYVEPDPKNPTMDPRKPIRALNQEVRRIKSSAEKQRLIAQGWYTDGSQPGTPNQFVAWRPTPSVRSRQATVWGYTLKTPAIGSWDWAGENGVRYLTNEYQYIPLFIMLNFAQEGAGYKGGKKHENMLFESLSLPENARYRVPAKLQALRNSFLIQAKQLTGSKAREQVDLLKNAALIGQLRWLRNHYLHRSARAVTEMPAYVGMEAASNDTRVIIRDDELVKKWSGRTKQKAGEMTDATKQKARAASKAASQGVEKAKQKMGELWNKVW